MFGPVCNRRRDVETSLYEPVKRFLEQLGYAVKGEVGHCDMVGLRDDDAVVVICELKMAFNLELILQGVDRASAGDEIWLAAQLSVRGKGRESDARYRNLCRRLGFGLLGVSNSGRVDILVSPIAPMPRKDPRRRSRLVDEHKRRQGDPVAGGGTRKPIMTAYRQQALACAAAMACAPQRPRDLKASFPDAQKILRRNVYGWFERSERGVYALTETGRSALAAWGPALPACADDEGMNRSNVA
ncbi:hypothetical protein KHC28_11450 [Ancylobacter sonchi]|nr:hypothetical protein [Ancylobacter sonchi]